MPKRVLIVDDEEHIRRVMRITLETAGYVVEEVSNGLDAVSLLNEGANWEVVILDQRMPGMDGLEVLQALKAKAPKIRVLMATAFASIELAVDAMKLGATDFVRKPMTPETLRNAVAAAITKESQINSIGPPKQEQIPDFQIITMNGFTILDSDNLRQDPNERRFVVRSPDGTEHEVLVQIADEAIAYVERMTRRSLPPANSFWTTQAERLLSDYLWKEGEVPPTRKLKISDIDRDELPIAARWQTN